MESVTVSVPSTSRGSAARRASGRKVGASEPEPYPDVVLPVVGFLELLRGVGQPLQSKRERKSECGECDMSRAVPVPSWGTGGTRGRGWGRRRRRGQQGLEKGCLAQGAALLHVPRPFSEQAGIPGRTAAT